MLYELNRTFMDKKDFKKKITQELEKLEINFECIDGRDFICTFQDGTKIIFNLLEVKNGIAILNINPQKLIETIEILDKIRTRE